MDEVGHQHHPDDELDVGYPSPSLYRQHQKSASAASTLYTIPHDYRYRLHPGADDSQHAAHELGLGLGEGESDLKTPSLLSSPSVASSLGFSNGLSPLRKELSRTSVPDEPAETNASEIASPCPKATGLGLIRGRTRPRSRYERDALARRLSSLAQQLAAGDDDFDDVGVGALTAQLDQMEKSMPPKAPAFAQSPAPVTPLARQGRPPQRPQSLDMRSRSDVGPGGSLFSSPAGSLYRSRFSEMSVSMLKDLEPQEEEEEEKPKMGMTVQQANKIIAEATKLNDELSKIVNNLKARQEESDHINMLLVERAERAAQRILFLQDRISHLERELVENDDELQHLRICLKAMEIQMPPHPDKELQRCLTSFKEDYKALKRKRQNRSSMPTMPTWDTSRIDSSIFETPAR